MKRFLPLLLFFHVSLSVKHTLTYFLTTSTGQKTLPEFVGVATLDGVNVGFCDGINRTEIRSDWMEEVKEKHPELITWHIQTCVETHNFNEKHLKNIHQFFDQTEGVHTLQELVGCEFDDQTDLYTGFDFYGYDGAGFVSLDPKRMTWTYTERAEPYKHQWDPDEAQLRSSRDIIRTICPKWLKVYLLYGKKSLQRKVPPSVSVLQKSPSSPISCFATGFYPNRADMFWRRDGEQTHEDVDHGEILPNPDGTFQMRVHLDLSSVTAQDWSRYECVFRGSGAESDIVTRLDQAVIRSNEVPPSSLVLAVVIGAVVLLLTVGIAGIFMWRRRRQAAAY
ncbi:major histocompatibility complex class I-related gene protein-like [Betta splendens]|uniref:Major histocompatibility complex class I-related gene protein-like n=1 Tax=Betta splendens TaxID=158456 RepID=A0A6P7P1Y6_BETSP|nr:major histocompatibility complex class I-related gene protein-like [Betta splendens]XP_055368902.1 major histocompatibility complex class I-related gene protein-like [Betta splendens]